MVTDNIWLFSAPDEVFRFQIFRSVRETNTGIMLDSVMTASVTYILHILKFIFEVVSVLYKSIKCGNTDL